MKLVAVCTGSPKTYQWNNKEVTSAILKRPVEGIIEVKFNGLSGDQQVNLDAHGGPDKAVYAFSTSTFSYWQETLKLEKINFGDFGENLSVDNLDEDKIYVGDTFTLGTCILQAVQPRIPCFKQEIIFNQPVIAKFNAYNRCGVYFRVLQEGQIQVGDTFKLIKSENVKASIIELFEIYKNKGQVEKTRAQELAAIPSMNEKWKNKFASI
jgi:MOSC domain-containing protein YiiM